MTDIDTKYNIIEEFTRGEVYFPSGPLIEFMNHNDLGIPLAQAATYHMVILTDLGEEAIEETWEGLCNLIGCPVDGDYDDYEDCLAQRKEPE